VRLLEPDRSDSNKTQDIRFADYRKLGGGWIAALVEVHLEGKKVFSEEYTEINGDVRLDPAVFDPKQFTLNPLGKALKLSAGDLIALLRSFDPDACRFPRRNSAGTFCAEFSPQVYC